jgi:hypothetical protein
MPENYVLLERTELNASAASVTFANIPQTGYTDLKIVTSTRSTFTDTPVAVKFNSVTTGYSWRRIYGSGSAASSQSGSDNYFMYQNISSQTANTFGSGELYIPNYTGNQAKSCSFDSLNENNATAADMFMLAGLNTMTDAITAITFTPLTGSFVANSTFSLYGIAAFGTTPAIAPKASGGNVIDFDGTNWIHTFLTSGTFTPQVGLTCDVLVIAGGGSGGSGNYYAGGGGAGGYRTSSGFAVTGGTPIAVTVGAGGAAPASGQTKGSNSIFSTITSTGGGGGGVSAISGQAGGSGGGAPGSGGGPLYSVGTGNEGGYSPVEGRNGGQGFSASGTGAGGGGGGSSAVGATGTSNVGGNGGAGTASSITGTSVTRAGGGGGSVFSGTIGTGQAGGGNGGANSGGTNATVNTGSGGGGTGDNVNRGGNGGSGIVIIRYPAA